MGQQVVVNPVTRIEGHARIVLDVDDGGDVERAHMQVLEIRGFEKLLQGMELSKMPQITARLCGVCPAAHHLAAVTAIESGLGVEPPERARLLRRLLYAGHVLHSHALSTFVLTGPDLLAGLGAEPEKRNVFSLLQLDRELCMKILRVRSIGQRTVELVGGRGVHPVTAVPGGMASAPDAEKLGIMAEWGREATGLLEELSAVLGEKLDEIQDLREAGDVPFHSLALSRDGAHDLLEGQWIVLDEKGEEVRRFDGREYGDHLVEHVQPGSYMKNVRLRNGEETRFFVGPLARLNVNAELSTPKAAAMLEQFRAAGTPRRSAVDNIPARLVEMVHCAELIGEIAGEELAGGDGPVRIESKPAGAGRFVGTIEAPRGVLVHDYTTDDDGRVETVNFIVATQNNYDAIDHSITAFARHLRGADDDNRLMNGAEFALRCYDPCLACATHAVGRMPMELEIRQGGRVVRTVRREGRR